MRRKRNRWFPIRTGLPECPVYRGGCGRVLFDFWYILNVLYLNGNQDSVLRIEVHRTPWSNNAWGFVLEKKQGNTWNENKIKTAEHSNCSLSPQWQSPGYSWKECHSFPRLFAPRSYAPRHGYPTRKVPGVLPFNVLPYIGLVDLLRTLTPFR